MKSSLVVLMLGSLSAHVGISFASSLGSTVKLTSGTVVGPARDSSGVLSYKGIPYAKPPVGSLRWRSPIPPDPWQSPLNASGLGNTCWSALTGDHPFTTQSEDCLTINVWTAANQTDDMRPVMFWIYGGGFQFGGSASPLYDGTNFAKQGVVFVSFNYRLGVFGFLGLEELDLEGEMSGDFGLQDMLLALHWVKKNIASFGGDPHNVTIAGESAGAHAVGMLMSSPLAKGLFQKAIMESGAWWDRTHGSMTTFAEARQYGLAFEKRVNVTSVAGLRILSAQVLNNAQPYNIFQDPGVTGFAPSVDRYVLPLAPDLAFNHGKQMNIPLLAGWNAMEQYVFLGLALPHGTAVQFETSAKELIDNRLPEFLSLYPDNTPTLLNNSADNFVGDLLIREQTWEAAYTQYWTTGKPVYVYFYNYSSTFSPKPSHLAELPFVFGNLLNNPIIGSVQPPGDVDRAFSKQVMGYWVNFIKRGNPNAQDGSLTTWPAYGTGGADIMGLSNSINPIVYDLSRFQFIRSFRNDSLLPASWRLLNVSVSGF